MEITAEDLKFEREYKKLLRELISYGTIEDNRTKVPTYTLANKTLEFDCKQYKGKAPVLTAKKMFFDKAYAEFKWMWEGRSDIAYLNEHGIYWWDEFADEDGEINRSYGYQLRSYNGSFDQIEYVIQQVQKRSRRAHMTFWNPCDLWAQDLPCCYTGMTFTLTDNGDTLNASMYFRSSDVFLGLPYDFIVGFLFLDEVAAHAGKALGKITYHLANAHVYSNHLDAVKVYWGSRMYKLPDYKVGKIENYESGPFIKAKLNN